MFECKGIKNNNMTGHPASSMCFIPDVIRVWDSLFADEKRFDFLIYVCCAMHL